MDSSGRILWLGRCGRAGLAEVGGKAVNLDLLLGAGFPAPPGFVVTTGAYDEAAKRCGVGESLHRLAAISPDDRAAIGAIARSIRDAFETVEIDGALATEIADAYDRLGGRCAVAVRSSATAEDLAQASFAGQQETYLDVAGTAAVLEAVRRCWASLWTERAMHYRAAAGVVPASVRLAVIVQEMIPARAAGVMFTANPVTGCRRQIVVDAYPGAGEAVVSGRVDTDHFMVDRGSGQVLSRRSGDGKGRDGGLSLDDGQLDELVHVGEHIERCFGVPQDIEFVFDPAGRLWITQTRAITTLFPLPPAPLGAGKDLRVYFSATADEGVVRPITPMGLQAFRMAAGAMAELFWGAPPRDRLAGPSWVVEAGMRTFYDITPIVRSATGRRFAKTFMAAFDSHTAAILDRLFHQPELSPRPDSVWRLAPVAIRPLWRFPLVSGVLASLRAPEAARSHRRESLSDLLDQRRPDARDTPAMLLAKTTSLLWDGAKALPRIAFLEPLASFVAFSSAQWILGKAAGRAESRILLSGAPNSATVRMNLDLWALAEALRHDPESRRAIATRTSEQLRDAFSKGALPPALAAGLKLFLAQHGHRAVFEVDLGLPRWSEDPTHILGSLGNYLRHDLGGPHPDVLHQRAAEAAAMTLRTVLARVGPVRRPLAAFLIGRARDLSGYREQWKDDLSRLWSLARVLLLRIGDALAAEAKLPEAEDIFFLQLAEIGDLLEGRGEDPRPLVRARREVYARELGRRRIPAVLLSDGTDASVSECRDNEAQGLKGIGASPGVARGRARVLVDPVGATIEPGEILVAPSTDPGWTPLFLTAAGLVMEKGAAMCHGAVVAREYGIPAVVGVADATALIQTGDMLEIDGGSGRVTALGDAG